jgi:hypothetical protein
MNETTETKQDLTCPECAAKGTPKTFKDPRARGTHRRIVHGVLGTSASVVSARKKKKRIGRPPGSGKSAMTPAKARERQAARVSGLVGYAVAKLEGLAQQIARENELPEKEFTQLVAGRLMEFCNSRE